jgi:phage baseplate assembly protein W
MTGVFVGRGLAYPMRVGPTGALALTGGDEEIAEKMRLILGTSPGERPMRPDFGCPIFEHVFSPADPATLGRIAFEVRAALTTWEPRVEITDVDVRPDAGQQTLLYIDVTYSVRDTNDTRNLVFPFYVIPDEEQQ